MKKLKSHWLILLAFTFITALMASSCKPESKSEAMFLELGEPSPINLLADQTSKEVAVKTNAGTVVTKVTPETATWLRVSYRSGKVILDADVNTDMTPREAKVTLTASGVAASFNVVQAGSAPFLKVSPETTDISANKQIIQLSVTSNKPYTLDTNSIPTWIKLITSNKEGTTHTWDFQIEQNILQKERLAELCFKSEDTSLNLKSLAKIKQQASTGYTGSSADQIGTDIKLEVMAGKASNHQDTEPIEKSYDGDYNTMYHSEWDNHESKTNYFPITLEYTFNNAKQIDYIIYNPRRDMNPNGNFKQVEIWAKLGTNGYVKIMDYDFKGASTPSKVVFPKPLTNCNEIKFVVKSGAGDGQGFAACAEMEFYQINSSNSVPLNIFTDGTASELRAGVTEEQILSMQNTLYKEVAYNMLKGTYPREFRIDTFKAYPHPDTEARTLKTVSYSILDNPTGIAVNADDQMVVLVGDTYGHSISLRLVNLDTPNEDGFDNGGSFALNQGVNMIKMPMKGMLYVMYHTPTFASDKPIKIHFLTGKVQGYFDISKHTPTNEEFEKRLNAANYNDYFDVVGKYAHLAFPVAGYKAYTSGRGKDLIDLYDNLVKSEQDFQGITKYNRTPHNRAYFQVSYNNMYMYSTAYRTCYNISTNNTVLDPAKVKVNIWGPAHELGHTLQTRPGLKWHGTTEVTNNILSLWIQTSWGNPSRIQTESMLGETNGQYENRYDKAYNSAFVYEKPYMEVGYGGSKDVFCQVVNFWQLQLYFSNVLGQNDFYKDLYELVRTEQDIYDDGDNQLEFTRRASQISGYNLIPFFEKWGFYRPFDKSFDDYGIRRMIITKAGADKVKAKINGMGLKAIYQRIEYISDANWQVYRDRLSVVAGGKATLNAERTKVTIPSDWKNAVAYEVYDASNVLIGVANNKVFGLTKPLPASGGHIYAVAHNGARTNVPF